MTDQEKKELREKIRESIRGRNLRKKLEEADTMPLVNENPTGVADPIQAAPEEVPAAPAPVESTPAETTTAESPVADSFTPPAPGMVPSGWVRPEDLANVVTAAQDEQDAVVQTSGDAETAQAVEVPEMPAGSEIAQPEATATPVQESILPKDGERKTPVSAEEEVAQEEELAKKAMKESEEDHEDEEDSSDDDVSENLADEGEEISADNVEDEDENTPDIADMFDNSNILDKLEAFFDNKDKEEVADLASALHSSANFLDYLLGDSCEECDDVEDSDDEEASDDEDYDPILGDDSFENEEDDAEEDEDSEDEEEESLEEAERIPFEKKHCDAPHDKTVRLRIGEQVKYPAGSRPEASEIANARRAEQVKEENLVRSYEEKVQARKEAIARVRENIKKNRNINAAASLKESHIDRFDEALRGRGVSKDSESVSSSSWENNKFIDRYTESEKFNFRKMLEDGTITNLLG